MQIRSRLTLQFILIVAIIMVMALVFIYYEFSLKVKNEFYGNLKSKAIMTADMVISSGAFHHKENKTTEEYENIPSYTENISVYNQQNKRLYSFNPLPDDIPDRVLEQIRSSEGFRFDHKHYKALGIVYKDRNETQYTIVAEAVFTSEALAFLKRILWIVFFLLTGLVAIGGWIFSGQALAPINQIMNQVDSILPANMSQRLKLQRHNYKDELDRLVETFNKLLSRIERAFLNQKMFVSYLSHELKNPISVIVNQLEVTLQKEREKEEYVHILHSVLEDAKNLNVVTNNLMQLSRITFENNDVEFKNLRIDELIWISKEDLLKVHADYKINFEIKNLPEDENELFFRGNESLIKSALINIMENGCKYSPDKTVDVRLSMSDQKLIRLDIENMGTGLSDTEAELIFKPYYRKPTDKAVRGHGVGLSLVSQIMAIHNIDISVDTAVPGRTHFVLLIREKNLQQPANGKN